MLKASSMSSEDRNNRIERALKYMEKEQELWFSIIFSSEKILCLDRTDGNTHRWVDTRLGKRYFSTRARGGRGLMIWDAIIKKCKSNLVFVEGKLNGQAYKGMLTDHLLLFIEERP